VRMDWFNLKDEEKLVILSRVAVATGISEAAIEKDIYVCWCLQQLFGDRSAEPTMIFKGGTSLSKVYAAINRFSEDIDITISPKYFFPELDIHSPSLSKKKLKGYLEAIDEAVSSFAINTLITSLTDNPPKGLRLSLGNSQTIYVEYSSVADDMPYFLKRVAIELGARNVIEPVEVHAVAPYAAEHFPQVVFPVAVRVNVLSPVRTFWEKATILHAEYHRPESRATDRIARHWYDMAMLGQHAIRDRALSSIDMLGLVAEYKDRIYPCSWASYGTACRNTLRLVPHKDLSVKLNADYVSMIRAGFFFSKAPSWECVLDNLRNLEVQIAQAYIAGEVCRNPMI
jgi:hypothetical protein